MDLKLVLAILPVYDVNRSKASYEKVGFGLELDPNVSDQWRAVPLTPPVRMRDPARQRPQRSCAWLESGPVPGRLPTVRHLELETCRAPGQPAYEHDQQATLRQATGHRTQAAMALNSSRQRTARRPGLIAYCNAGCPPGERTLTHRWSPLPTRGLTACCHAPSHEREGLLGGGSGCG